MGADTRSTSGDIVADKNCMKIHELAPNMVGIKFKENLAATVSNTQLLKLMSLLL